MYIFFSKGLGNHTETGLSLKTIIHVNPWEIQKT